MAKGSERVMQAHMMELEAEAIALEQEINQLENGVVLNPPDELQKLVTENEKLKYRLKHLEWSLKTENSSTATERLTSLFASAFRRAFPTLPDDFEAKVIASEKFADFQCNDALSSLADFKKLGLASNPRQIADSIIKNVPTNNIIAKLDIAGPGFINITIKDDFITKFIKETLVTQRVEPPVVERKRVIVDFSAPNIAKEMHVGHLRSTIIGDSISRLLEWMGHDVLRLNHIGDWGTQFGMLIAHLQDKFPDFATVSPPIQDLQAFYKEAKKRFDAEEDFKKRAYALVVRLQSYDPEIIKAWNLICDVSRRDFDRIYSRLDVNIIERGESFYQPLMDDMVAELKSKSFLKEEEGRWLMFIPGQEIPLTMVKSDGGYTYDTSDMAAIRQRIKDEKAEWLIYVVDSGQSLHFSTFFAAAKLAGWLDPYQMRCKHVAFGVVLGEDGKKFKSRSGDTVKLTNLLDEGLKRAKDTLIAKERHLELTEEEMKVAQEAIAYGCIKYADLSHNYVNNYVFSFDRMLDDKGNTAVYLLYSLTRIRSIRRKANISIDELQSYAKENEIVLKEKSERKLGKCLIGFHDVIKRVMLDLHIHYLCDYLYNLSTVFSEFYDNCYCIEKQGDKVTVHKHRLVLCECTAIVMEKVFDILGIKTVSRM